MNRIAGVINIHLVAKWLLALGWLIVLPSFILHWAIAAMVNHDQTIYVGGVSPVYITAFITGITSTIQTFPFALGFSATRRDYFLGTVGTYTLASALSATILVIMALIEKQLSEWGEHLYFFNLPWLNDGTVLQQVFAIFVILSLFYFGGLMIGALYLRFGARGLFLFLGAVLLMVSAAVWITTINYWWIPMWNWLMRQSAAQVAWWLIPMILIQALAAYTMLRRADV